MPARTIVNIGFSCLWAGAILALASLSFPAFARITNYNSHHSSSQAHRTHQSTSTRSSHSRSTASSRRHKITSEPSTTSGRHRGRYYARRHRRGHAVAHVRYAYPMNFFLWHAPQFDQSLLSPELAQKVKYDFLAGKADTYLADTLVRAGVATYYPLKGGIFWRREPVKYIIVHSTESGNVIDARRIIDSWGSLGRRHAGAQYVVDRDGRIFQAVDPDLATVHINIFKTLPGINNDNAVGIEMVHGGSLSYTPEQKASVIRLVAYLQDHFQVADENVITHRYAQQGDHTDPVNFDWSGFLASKAQFRKQALSEKMTALADEAKTWWTNDDTDQTVLLQPNGKLPMPGEKPSAVYNVLDRPIAHPVRVSPKSPSEPTKRAQAPELRGPIEMDPKDAKLLNSEESR